jgi:2-polyprenyl-3-methyl-5-hydroxy-6-metoxy-1,4-benzoquinol methylase
MNTPDQVFREVWRERLVRPGEDQYREGENQRVDLAARLLPSGQRLLDVGCGAGILGLAVKNSFNEVYGVDIADYAVESARNNGLIASRVDLNSTALPFDSDFFDAVTFLSVIPYIYDPYYVLRECHRVLRPDGMLILSVANMRTMGKLLSIVVRGRFPVTSKGVNIGYDGGALHYFCSADLVQLFAATRFAVIAKYGLFYRPKFIKTVDRAALLGHLACEFFAGEVLFVARKES